MDYYVCKALDWYQIRIGSHDKQLWEKFIDEKSTFKNKLYVLSKKSSTTRVDNLIDIDLVKGSSFPKTKNKLSLINALYYGSVKLLFFPFYFEWWRAQTSKLFACILLVVYLLQLATCYIYANNDFYLTVNNKPVITLNEVFTPTLIMFILGIVYTYITSVLPNTTSDIEKFRHSDNQNQHLQTAPTIPTLVTEPTTTTTTNPTSDNVRRRRNRNEPTNTSSTPLLTISTSTAQINQDLNNNQDEKRKPKLLKSTSCSPTTTTTATTTAYDNDDPNLNSNLLLDYDDDEQYDESDENDDTAESQTELSSEINPRPATLLHLNGPVKVEKISCLIWENEWKGADMSMLEISTHIIENADKTALSPNYFYLGCFFSMLISVLPVYYHESVRSSNLTTINNSTISGGGFSRLLSSCQESFEFWSSVELGVAFLILSSIVSTLFLCVLFFSLLTIAERTLSQRFLHAKFFCYLTSIRRARKHNLPHFRLSRVDNIKTWLSVRSYVKRRGPQRSIDSIISCTFLCGVALCSAVCIRFLQDDNFLSADSLLNRQLVVWCVCIWTFMMRFMSIGFRINKKYRTCHQMVITEQINLYLQMEKKPAKKEEFMVVNNVLKLAADLLKEIENPFKISGLGVNPWVYNITKVVILSAASAVLSELFGFKLKLYKIKIG
jgi:hypothetical protein